MSVHATVRAIPAPTVDPARPHRRRLLVCWALAMALVLALAAYGFDYYHLDAAHRPLSAKHQALKPSGRIGVRLGMLGALLFLVIYVYPIRMRWGWLGRQGNSRHWLDFHVVLGVTAPFIIAFHSAFKFRGIAGVAFWIMVAVALSGGVGRYLYAQIPPSLSAAEISMKEMQDREATLHKELAEQKSTFGFCVEALYHLPTPEYVGHAPMLVALLSMFLIDFRRPFQTSLLRLREAGFGPWVFSFGGLLPTHDRKLERAIVVAQKQAALSKHILFLTRTQQVFQLWHVVHRPFSYAFAILALLHIGLALVMGYGL
jgi:hypothetical protein